MKNLMVVVIFMLACVPALATETVAILAGHLFDPATGKVTRQQTILVRDQVITAVGKNLDVPAGSRIIDLSDAWVLPGLIDTHVHLTLGLAPVQPPFENFFKATTALWSTEPTALRALRGLHNASVLLNAGFTTVRDVGRNKAETTLPTTPEKRYSRPIRHVPYSPSRFRPNCNRLNVLAIK